MQSLSFNPALALPFALFAATAAILYGVIVSFRIVSLDAGNLKMRKIADAIAEGASAYLSRQYLTIAPVAVFIFAVIWLFISFETAVGFLVGAVASATAGFLC